MAWRQERIAIAGRRVDGQVNRGAAGGAQEMTVTYAETVAPGVAVDLRDGGYRVVAVEDPGNRHEHLRCTLAATEASRRRRRKSKTEAAA